MLILCAAMAVPTAALADHGRGADHLRTKPAPSIHIGGLGQFSIPDSAPVVGYVFLGVGGRFEANEHISLVLEFDANVAPVLGNWGFSGFALAEITLAKWLFFDIGPGLVFDWDPKLQKSRAQPATGYVSFLGGPTFLFRKSGVTISVGVTVNGSLEGLGWSYGPFINIGLPLRP